MLEIAKKGLVRNIYDVSDDALVVVATDRVSADGVLLPVKMPSKGKLVNQMSQFWYEVTKGIVPNAIIATDQELMPQVFQNEGFEGRCTLVKNTQVLPIKVFLYNFLIGSMWKEYKEKSLVTTDRTKYINVGGKDFFQGLEEGCQFSSPVMIFKAKLSDGSYKLVSESEARKTVGGDTLEKCKSYALAAVDKCTEYARSKEIILADTQISFGRDEDGNVYAVGDFFSPDSTRYWITKRGESFINYDKQIIIEYLLSKGWKRGKELPPIPKSIVYKTATRYIELYEILTGEMFV